MSFIARNGCICVQYRENEDFYNDKTNIRQHMTIFILEKSILDEKPDFYDAEVKLAIVHQLCEEFDTAIEIFENLYKIYILFNKKINAFCKTF